MILYHQFNCQLISTIQLMMVPFFICFFLRIVETPKWPSFYQGQQCRFVQLWCSFGGMRDAWSWLIIGRLTQQLQCVPSCCCCCCCCCGCGCGCGCGCCCGCCCCCCCCRRWLWLYYICSRYLKILAHVVIFVNHVKVRGGVHIA